MAGDEESSKWSLDLDASDAISSLNDFSDTLKNVFSADDISGLLEKFESLGITLGVVGAAIFAMKESLDLVLEGEQINAVNAQFENLADNVGISADKLKQGLIEAANGTVTETEALQAANKAMTSLGGNAEKIPQVMELARQATAVFGGTAIDNFNALNQAIASGSTRQLRHLGIIIDSTKAQRDYAASIGITVSSLSQSEKQAATLNAVLAQGSERFAGQNADIKETTTALTQFKVAVTEIGETVSLVFSKTLGPTFKKFFNSLAGWSGAAKTQIQASFGDGADAAAAKVTILTQKIIDQRAQVVQLGSDYVALDKTTQGGDVGKAIQASIIRSTQLVDVYKKQLDQAQQSIKKFGGAEKQAADDSSTRGGAEADLVKRLDAQNKFEAKLQTLRNARLKSDEAVMNTDAQAEAAFSAERLSIIQASDLKEDEVKKSLAKGQIANQQQADLLLEQINLDKNNKLKAQEQDLIAFRTKAAENYLKQSTSIADGIARGFVAGSRAAEASLQDFSQVGDVAFKSVKKNSISAFEAMGQGSESAGDAMKGFMFNSIADIAEAQGELLLATALLNPLNGIAGAALLVLAGFLRGQAGGSGGGSSAPSAGGDASAAGPSALGGSDLNNTGTSLDMTQQAHGKGVTINVAGHYLETAQTAQLITSLVRQSSDATNYTVAGVGGGV